MALYWLVYIYAYAFRLFFEKHYETIGYPMQQIFFVRRYNLEHFPLFYNQ